MPKRIVDILISERVVVSLIVLNAASLFVLGTTEHGTQLYRALFAVDYVCVIYFVIEAALKIGRFRWRGYWADGWNRFDFIVVLLSLPALLAPFIDLHGFAAILALRLGRLFRLLRLLRFIPEHHRMIEGSLRALRASVGVFLALLLINVMLAIGASLLFAQAAPEHFGNPLLSCYTMFKIFTIEGWYHIPDMLAEQASHPGWAIAARLYFIGAVVVGGILGLSLANAIFVDQMLLDNNDPLKSSIEDLREEITHLRREVRELRSENVNTDDTG